VLRTQIYSEFGRLIAERRKRSGMTQQAFAKALDLSRATVANIERGKQAVQLHVIIQMAAVLNIDVQELIPTLDQGIPTIQVKDWLKRATAQALGTRADA
jgi:transcriptional regulator with XRE-family HTH domain